jgi:hypothetical protein
MEATERMTYVCGRCDRWHLTRDEADACCVCEEPGCAATVERYTSRRKDHLPAYNEATRRARAEERSAQDRAAFEKARKVSWRAYDGPVFVDDGSTGSCGEGFYRNAAELLDWRTGDGATAPPWCWATRPMPRLALDADSILEGYLDDYPEDAGDGLDVAALQTALDAWCAGNQPVSFEADYSTAIVFDDVATAPSAEAAR